MRYKLSYKSPADWLSKLQDPDRRVCLFTGDGSGWGTFLAWNPAAIFNYRRGDGNISSIKDFVHAQTGEGRQVMGYLSYDLGYKLLGINQTAEDDLALPDVRFLAFENYLEITPDATVVHYQQEGYLDEVRHLAERPSAFLPVSLAKPFQPVASRGSYDAAFGKIKQYIVEGDVYQVNLTHRLEARTESAPRFVFARLMERAQSGFMAYLEGDDFALHSVSPERFVRIKNGKLDTYPIKGTRPRGSDATDDKRLQDELLASAKDAAELNMITDLLRNDVGKVAEAGTVLVKAARQLLLGQDVMHSYSHISGRLSSDIKPIEALLSMSPGGSITGCPKKRAMEIIDELEPFTRSVYCGSFVMINPDGTLDSNIAIRTVTQVGGRLVLPVGGGIVQASDSAAEYQESLDKAATIVKALS